MSTFVKSDLNKMMLFMFLGLVIAILVLGFHKSPKPSPATGRRLRTQTGVNQPSRLPSTPTTSYPSDKRDY